MMGIFTLWNLGSTYVFPRRTGSRQHNTEHSMQRLMASVWDPALPLSSGFIYPSVLQSKLNWLWILAAERCRYQCFTMHIVLKKCNFSSKSWKQPSEADLCTNHTNRTVHREVVRSNREKLDGISGFAQWVIIVLRTSYSTWNDSSFTKDNNNMSNRISSTF